MNPLKTFEAQGPEPMPYNLLLPANTSQAPRSTQANQQTLVVVVEIKFVQAYLKNKN